jgi:hypothetical protein
MKEIQNFGIKSEKRETNWLPRCGHEENMNMDLPEVRYVEINSCCPELGDMTVLGGGGGNQMRVFIKLKASLTAGEVLTPRV